MTRQIENGIINKKSNKKSIKTCSFTETIFVVIL